MTKEVSFQTRFLKIQKKYIIILNCLLQNKQKNKQTTKEQKIYFKPKKKKIK